MFTTLELVTVMGGRSTTKTDGDGAVVGTHEVTIVVLYVPTSDPYDPENGAAEVDEVNESITDDDLPKVKSTLIPQKYAEASTSGLTVEVESDRDKSQKFTLKD